MNMVTKQHAPNEWLTNLVFSNFKILPMTRKSKSPVAQMECKYVEIYLVIFFSISLIEFTINGNSVRSSSSFVVVME